MVDNVSDPQETADQNTDQVTDETTLDDSESQKSDDLNESTEQTDETDDGESQTEDDSDDSTDDGPVEFGEWAKQYGLSDDIKSEDDLAERYATLVEQAKTQKIEPKTDPAPEQKPHAGVVDEQAPFFANNPFATQVETMVKNGALKAEDAGNYRTIATFSDQVMNPIMGKMLGALSALTNQVLSNRQHVEQSSWNSVAPKLKDTGVTMPQIQALMRTHNFNSMDEALYFHAIKNDPSLLAKIANNAEEKGLNKGRKKLKRSTAKRKNRGGSPGSQDSSGFDHRKFANPDGSMNEDAVRGVLGLHEQSDVIEAYEKWAVRRQRRAS